MILLFSHVRTGRWASVMPAKLAETLGLTDTLRAIPIIEPEAEQTIGLVVPAREPMMPITAALVEEARAVAATLDREFMTCIGQIRNYAATPAGQRELTRRTAAETSSAKASLPHLAPSRPALRCLHPPLVELDDAPRRFLRQLLVSFACLGEIVGRQAALGRVHLQQFPGGNPRATRGLGEKQDDFAALVEQGALDQIDRKTAQFGQRNHSLLELLRMCRSMDVGFRDGATIETMTGIARGNRMLSRHVAGFALHRGWRLRRSCRGSRRQLAD